MSGKSQKNGLEERRRILTFDDLETMNVILNNQSQSGCLLIVFLFVNQFSSNEVDWFLTRVLSFAMNEGKTTVNCYLNGEKTRNVTEQSVEEAEEMECKHALCRYTERLHV